MRGRVFRYVLDVALLAVAVLVTGTGLVVDRLDLNDFVPHRWAGYAFAVLAAVHVAMRGRALVPFRHGDRRRGPPQPVPATAADPSRAGGTTISTGRTREAPAPDSAADGDSGRRPPAASAAPAPAEGRPTGRRGPSRRTALTATVGAGVTGAAAGWLARSGRSPDPYGGGDVGAFYHRESSLGLRGLLGGLLNWGSRPEPYQRVGDAPAVSLPAPTRRPSMTIAQGLSQRRSLRAYAPRAVTGEELAWLLSAATGITSGSGYRTAPSAGALYPIETYVAVDRVERIDPGLYHLDVRARALEPLREGSVAGDLMIAGLGQDFLRTAPVVVVLTGLFQRTRWKYHERHYRYVCWEGGHIAQNLYLAAEAAGLGACMVGAFLDGMVNDLLRVDGRQEAALGLIAVGPR
ncbi:MAG TPA: SagB/ThcOx family dehydrogenase [Kineosporiaceae bacterium]|nr:SagB/ThcOx family dehydrogenase [Kineosporiaceae bacterium]